MSRKGNAWRAGDLRRGKGNAGDRLPAMTSVMGRDVMNDEKDEEDGAGDEPAGDVSSEGAPKEDAPPQGYRREPVPLAWEAAVAAPDESDQEADALGAEESDGDEVGGNEGGVKESGDDPVAEDVVDALEGDDEDVADDEGAAEAEAVDLAGEEGDEEADGEAGESDEGVTDEGVTSGAAAAADEPVEEETLEAEPVEELPVGETPSAPETIVEEVEPPSPSETGDEPAEALVMADEVDETPLAEAEVVAPEAGADAPVDDGVAGGVVTPATSGDASTGLAMAGGSVASRAPGVIQYAKRNTRLDKQDCGWWVDGDYLYETDGRGREWRTHLGDVLEVQTAPAPAKFRPWRHQTVLGLRNSRRIAIDNAHYLGTANYEERSAAYAPFVRQLIEVITEKAPYAKARRGASYLGYVAMLAFVAVLIGLVATLVFLLPIEGVPGIVWIKAGLVALMAPPLFAWVVKSRPTGMRLADLPPGALPRARP